MFFIKTIMIYSISITFDMEASIVIDRIYGNFSHMDTNSQLTHSKLLTQILESYLESKTALKVSGSFDQFELYINKLYYYSDLLQKFENINLKDDNNILSLVSELDFEKYDKILTSIYLDLATIDGIETLDDIYEISSMSLRRSSRDNVDFNRNGAYFDLELQIILDTVGGNGRGVKRCTIAPYSDFYEPSVCRQILKSPRVKTNGILKFMTTGAFKTTNIPLMTEKSANENQSYDNLNLFDVLIRSFNRDFLIGTDNLAHLRAFNFLNIHLLDISDINNGRNEIKGPKMNKKSRFQNKLQMMNVKDTNGVDKHHNNMRIFRIASIELFDQVLGDYCGKEERISYESSDGNFQYYFTFQCGGKEEKAHLAADNVESIKMIQVVRSRLSETLQISVHTSLGLTYPLREYLAKNGVFMNQIIVIELEEVEGKEAPDVDFWIFKRQESTEEFCGDCVQGGGTENEDIKKVLNPNQEVKDMQKDPDLAKINEKLKRIQKIPLKMVVIRETGLAPISLTLAFIVFSLSMICFIIGVEWNYIN